MIDPSVVECLPNHPHSLLIAHCPGRVCLRSWEAIKTLGDLRLSRSQRDSRPVAHSEVKRRAATSFSRPHRSNLEGLILPLAAVLSLLEVRESFVPALTCAVISARNNAPDSRLEVLFVTPRRAQVLMVGFGVKRLPWRPGEMSLKAHFLCIF